jgi:hypothetical protein
MKRVLLFIFIAFIVFPLTASAQTIELKVNGIEIGAYYSTVLKKLGKPLSKKKGGSFPCDDDRMMTMRYAGLILKLIPDNNNRYFVAAMEVTSRKWVTSGIMVGANIKDVQRRFGRNDKPRKEKVSENLPYFIKDGYANFYFRNKKLVRINWELNAC